jgi:hypothetical protein
LAWENIVDSRALEFGWVESEMRLVVDKGVEYDSENESPELDYGPTKTEKVGSY